MKKEALKETLMVGLCSIAVGTGLLFLALQAVMGFTMLTAFVMGG